MRVPIVLVLLALPLAAGARECRYSADRNFDLDAAGLRTVALKLGSSDLVLEGVPGLKRVEVRGKACASDPKWLDELTVRQERGGDRLTVTADNRDRGIHISLFGSSYAYLDLHVRVPAALAAAVDSGSGDVDAGGVASLDFGSGSGDLRARNIAGALILRLGSADVEAHDVGSVELRSTGSGDVRVDGVRGDVDVGHSGSGDLNFAHVGGNVRVESTGSGDVGVSDVGRDVWVGSTGSGDVSASGVRGNFTVESTGSGDISYRDIGGKVSVPHVSGD
ncbi:hypothetical protein MBSD_n0599 [Mizugakiibacter sediminis]|uniref:DUF4097 domain-containing protein n=1 Tax=Mizugakiibacter sediminis TaxID=1475481 RepID=A0A0K8QK41_9GAMM|nr:DUF4097 family beta strand repeat-containing protein [Mizugakiibacter sediminis]GAP65310.1 hypothetical protein MBSD_n0599 [Mizugakiibacter sediminis]